MLSRLSGRSRRRLRTTLTILVTVLIIAPAAALAGHQFNDVPNSNVFHEDIEWMRDNGVTKGCNPQEGNTEYCPDENVTREQMAAFMHRLETENVFVRPGQDAVDGGNADTVDGMHASDFLAATDKAVDSDKLDGKNSTAFLGSDASVVHRMSVSATELWYDNATEGSGDNEFGLVMPESGSSSFSYGFTLPDTYNAGDEIRVEVLGWMNGDSSCDVRLLPNFTSFMRPGMVPTANGSTASAGLAPKNGSSTFPMPTTTSEATTKAYVLEWSEGPQPGDTIGFGLFRGPGFSGDTCTGAFHVGGLEITWG